MNQGIYNNLVAQFDKIDRHNRQGSIQTKRRYREAFLRFLAFVAEFFRLEKLSNISEKHIRSYVDHLQERGCSIAFVKTELSAIRFWFDQIPNTKHPLPINKELALERRQYGGVDRTWSDAEFDRALDLESSLELPLYVSVLTLARFGGLRLHEAFRMDTRDAEVALASGVLTVKGKGGLIRKVPTTPEIDTELRKVLDITPRGNKLFVKVGGKTHLCMQRLEQFLYDHKAEIQNPGSTRPLTAHGLRHVYSVEKYKEFIAQGLTEKAARLQVARLLGHGRDSITKVYLAALDHQEGGEVDSR